MLLYSLHCYLSTSFHIEYFSTNHFQPWKHHSIGDTQNYYNDKNSILLAHGGCIYILEDISLHIFDYFSHLKPGISGSACMCILRLLILSHWLIFLLKYYMPRCLFTVHFSPLEYENDLKFLILLFTFNISDLTSVPAYKYYDSSVVSLLVQN